MGRTHGETTCPIRQSNSYCRKDCAWFDENKDRCIILTIGKCMDTYLLGTED